MKDKQKIKDEVNKKLDDCGYLGITTPHNNIIFDSTFQKTAKAIFEDIRDIPCFFENEHQKNVAEKVCKDCMETFEELRKKWCEG